MSFWTPLVYKHWIAPIALSHSTDRNDAQSGHEGHSVDRLKVLEATKS